MGWGCFLLKLVIDWQSMLAVARSLTQESQMCRSKIQGSYSITEKTLNQPLTICIGEKVSSDGLCESMICTAHCNAKDAGGKMS